MDEAGEDIGVERRESIIDWKMCRDGFNVTKQTIQFNKISFAKVKTINMLWGWVTIYVSCEKVLDKMNTL